MTRTNQCKLSSGFQFPVLESWFNQGMEGLPVRYRTGPNRKYWI
jgi:hypothetical protein